MDAGFVNACIGSVGVVGIQGIFYAYITVLACHLVHIAIGAVDGEGLAGSVEGFYIVYVLAKFMGGITAG